METHTHTTPECNMSIENKLAKFSGLKPDETRLSESQMLVGVRSEPAIWTTHRSGNAALRVGIPSPNHKNHGVFHENAFAEGGCA